MAELKPRAHYEKRFCLMSENLEISNDRGMEAGRYVVKTEKAEKKAVCCNWIGILGTKMHLMYNETMISEPFDLSIQISAPAITSEEFNVHDNTRNNLRADGGLFTNLRRQSRVGDKGKVRRAAHAVAEHGAI